LKIALIMLVRDEQAVIERALRSAMPLIDHWIVIDTGSVDNTPAIVCETLRGIPGTLHHREWKGFADARSDLLALANVSGMDYALTLDADMTIEGTIPENLDKDLYYISIGDAFTWRLPLLTKVGKPWSYKGVCHSYLACDEEFTGENLDTLKITHHAEGRPREEKFRRDIDLLNGYLKDHPDDPRSVYYLAQSFKDLGDYRTAAELYRRRAHLKGWAEETFHARYREGQMRYKLGELERAVWCLLEAWSFRPSRAEPLRSLAQIYRQRGVHAAARMFDAQADLIPMTQDRLFVEANAYKLNRIDWDEWRKNYDVWSFEEHKAFYEQVAKLHPVQHQWDGPAVREFLGERQPRYVVEIGGWDGSLAKEMLAEFPAISSWLNLEIADVPQACQDERYERIHLTRWPWMMDVKADALIASHVVEHMRANEFEKILRRWDVDSVFIDTPILSTPTSWTGYQGSHIIEVGSAELVGRLCALGYRPTVVRPEGRLLAFLDKTSVPMAASSATI
jgi:glycosyltransferase involved in cell wall biosynthesis